MTPNRVRFVVKKALFVIGVAIVALSVVSWVCPFAIYEKRREFATSDATMRMSVRLLGIPIYHSSVVPTCLTSLVESSSQDFSWLVTEKKCFIWPVSLLGGKVNVATRFDDVPIDIAILKEHWLWNRADMDLRRKQANDYLALLRLRNETGASKFCQDVARGIGVEALGASLTNKETE